MRFEATEAGKWMPNKVRESVSEVFGVDKKREWRSRQREARQRAGAKQQQPKSNLSSERVLKGSDCHDDEGIRKCIRSGPRSCACGQLSFLDLDGSVRFVTRTTTDVCMSVCASLRVCVCTQISCPVAVDDRNARCRKQAGGWLTISAEGNYNPSPEPARCNWKQKNAT